MIYWQLFLAFFIPNIVGYGGGPAIIPLIENEVVGTYGWMTHQGFAETLALGNALPSPIATKMAGYIGYRVGGVLGAHLSGAGPRVTRCGASRNRAVDGTRPAVTDARASGGVNEPRSPPRLTSLGCCSDEVGALFTCNSADWR